MSRIRVATGFWVGAISLALVGCSADSTAPGVPDLPVPAAVTALGNLQVGTVGTALAEKIGVRVHNSDGGPMEGVVVEFAVTSGGGSLDGSRATTDALGEAWTTWILGTVVRISNTVVPAVSGFPGTLPIIQAVAMAGPAVRLEVVSGDAQTGMASVELPVPLVARALDSYGNVVTGDAIMWSVAGSNGVLLPVVSSTSGTSSVAWITGSTSGVQRAAALLPAAPLDTLFFTASTTPVASEYDISLLFVTPLSPTQAAAFDSAATRWARVIIEDLPSVSLAFNTADCAAGSIDLNQAVDDVLILVKIDSLDGPGGRVGAGSPCLSRMGSVKVVVGVAILDSADVASLESRGLLRAAALQQVGLALGFGGAAWYDAVPPTVVEGFSNYTYVGARSVAQLNRLHGWTLPYFYLETSPHGSSPWNFFWPSLLMPGELMTSPLSDTGGRLSAITIASFADLGYRVSYAGADDLAVGTSPAGREPSHAGLASKPLRPRLKVVDAAGTISAR